MSHEWNSISYIYGGLYMFEVNAKAIKICDTTLRDGHQSLMATRLKMSDMLPLLEQMDQLGSVSYTHLTLPTIYSV